MQVCWWPWRTPLSTEKIICSYFAFKLMFDLMEHIYKNLAFPKSSTIMHILFINLVNFSTLSKMLLTADQLKEKTN